MIDSQSVNTTESGGIWGFDAGKKVKGRKRHILTDTCGCLIFILVHAADIQDRDGAVDMLAAVPTRFPWLRHVFADDGYAMRVFTMLHQGADADAIAEYLNWAETDHMGLSNASGRGRRIADEVVAIHQT